MIFGFLLGNTKGSGWGGAQGFSSRELGAKRKEDAQRGGGVRR